MKIYSQDLKDTCISLEAFDKLFPDGAEISADSIEKCQGIFDIASFLDECGRRNSFFFLSRAPDLRERILNLEQTFYYQHRDIIWITQFRRAHWPSRCWLKSYELELLPPDQMYCYRKLFQKFYEISTGFMWNVRYLIPTDIDDVRSENIFVSLSTNPGDWRKIPSKTLTRPWSDLATVTGWKDLRELTAQWDYLDDLIDLKEGLKDAEELK